MKKIKINRLIKVLPQILLLCAFVSCSTIQSQQNSDDSSTSAEASKAVTWLDSSVPSLYETYKDQFDYIGIAAEYGNFGLSKNGSNKYTAKYTANGYWGTPSELYYEEIRNGIAKHANSITPGNELKPQFVLAWWSTGNGSKQSMTDFTASNGKTIKVPSSLNNENLIYATLNAAKEAGVKMRGHVLTWHSQTPDDFFAENYSAKSDGELLSNIVDKETMTARHEWYIKSVLECVSEWEKANGYGEGNHLIWAWDVVNEAAADDAGQIYSGSSANFLRGATDGTKNKTPDNGGSRWYQIYGSDEFIVNAFRFANAYAPSDVKLCYNDYNEYMEHKTSAICQIVKDVQNGEEQTVNGKSVKPRIDVVGMQSHLGTDWPGTNAYESAIKKFLGLGCNIHVSEMDFSATSRFAAVKAYKDYFTLFQKYGNSYSGTNKIECVTVWGLNDENSWINPSNSGKTKTYPLLFNLIDNVSKSKKTAIYKTGTEDLPLYDIGDSYTPNESFWAVINAHKE